MDFKKEYQEKYGNLRNQYYSYRSQEKYSDMRKTASTIISLINSTPSSFNDVDDLINFWRSQNALSSYYEFRKDSSQTAIKFLNEAFDLLTPSVCKSELCALSKDDSCIVRQPLLSPIQKKMCVERNNSKTNILKIEAAIAARGFDYQVALQKRREAARLADITWNLEKNPERRENRDYLDYWLNVTEGYIALQNGNFQNAKDSFRKSIELGKSLSKKHCFPNYFQNVKEIESHGSYIEGVQSFKDRDFSSARSHFQSWLNLNSEHQGRFYLRYDNILVFSKISIVLEHVAKHEEASTSEWDEIDELFERGYIARTTWALKIYLDDVRNLSKLAKRGFASNDSVDKIINDISERWNLLIPDAVLLGEDRVAAVLNRHVVIPSFLDIFNRISASSTNWQAILVQNLKNLFLIMADYEFFRYTNPPQEEINLPHDVFLKPPSEELSIDKLIKFISFCLEHRSGKHKIIFDKAVARQKFEQAIEQNDFQAAISEQKKIFTSIRFWPLVIKIISHQKIAYNNLFEHDEEDFLINETKAKRLSDQYSDIVTFEGNQDVVEGSFYYLRPRWNIRSYDRYRVRHEKFYRSEIPGLVKVFYENLFEDKKVAYSKFQDWIFQFDDNERLKACKLFEMLNVYDADEVRQMWLDLYCKKLPPEAKIKNVIYTGLGHTAKSGANCLYYFRQAIAHLESNEKSFSDADAFKVLSDSSINETKPDSIVFVDDLIGSGKQASRYLSEVFEEHEWLKDKKVYYCALFGYEQGIQEMQSRFGNKLQEVYVHRKLNETNKAFSKRNPVWENERDCINTEQWAAKIGYDVLGRGYDRENHKLGWDNSQALIAFFYNVPNNTLPIFWGTGTRNGKLWKPLLDRHE